MLRSLFSLAMLLAVLTPTTLRAQKVTIAEKARQARWGVEGLVPMMYCSINPPHAERKKNYGSPSVQIERMNVESILISMMDGLPREAEEVLDFNDIEVRRPVGRGGLHVALVLEDGKEWRYVFPYGLTRDGVSIGFPLTLAHYPVNRRVKALRFYLGPFLSREIPVDHLANAEWPKITCLRPNEFNATIHVEGPVSGYLNYHLTYRDAWGFPGDHKSRYFRKHPDRLLTDEEATVVSEYKGPPQQPNFTVKHTLRMHLKEKEAAFAKLPKEIQESRKQVYGGGDLNLYIFNGFDAYLLDLGGRRGRTEFIPPSETK